MIIQSHQKLYLLYLSKNDLKFSRIQQDQVTFGQTRTALKAKPIYDEQCGANHYIIQSKTY